MDKGGTDMAEQYDGYGNLIGKSIDHGNGRTDYFDLSGNLTGFSIDKGAGYADQYDANGYILGTSYRDASGNITYYDNLGRPVSQKKADVPGAGNAGKLSTVAAVKSLLVPDRSFDAGVRRDTEDVKGGWIARIVMMVILAAATFLLARAQLPYAAMYIGLTLVAFYLSRSFHTQRIMTGMIVVNTVYTLLLSKVYAQFLWMFPTEDVEPLQYCVVGAFFLIGLIFTISIEAKGYYSYGLTRAAEVLFFLAYSVAWLICYLLHLETLEIRAVLDLILSIQAVYSVVVIMARAVEMLNLVRSKSGVSESTGAQLFRYALYVVLFLAVRAWDPEGLSLILVLLICTAVAFTLTRLNLLNRFRIVTVSVNSLYTIALTVCYTYYLFHLYAYKPRYEWLLFALVLFCVLFFARNLEQEGYQSFRFTRLAVTLFLLAPAVLYVTYRLHIAQDFTWYDIRSFMQYILIGAAVFSAGVIGFHFLTGARKKGAKKTA